MWHDETFMTENFDVQKCSMAMDQYSASLVFFINDKDSSKQVGFSFNIFHHAWLFHVFQFVETDYMHASTKLNFFL